jgi:hypothetical protein
MRLVQIVHKTWHERTSFRPKRNLSRVSCHAWGLFNEAENG